MGLMIVVFVVVAIIIFNRLGELSEKILLLQQRMTELYKEIEKSTPKTVARPVEQLKAAAEKAVRVSSPEIPAVELTELQKDPEKVQTEASREVREKTPGNWLKLERIIGERWLVWVGTLVFAAGFGIFMKYAFEQGWINEVARITLGFIGGLLLIAFSEFLYRKNFRALAQGISALGLIVLYLTVFTAYHFYHMLGAGTAFFLFFITTVGGMYTAMHHNSFHTAFLSTLGAFLTPLFLVDPASAVYYEPKLFSYLLIINAGVLYSSSVKKWRILSLFSFLFTVFYFDNWYFRQYVPADFPVAMSFAVIYFTVFSMISTVYSIVRKKKSRWEDIILVIANPVTFFIIIYNLLENRGVTGILPCIPVFMAAYHFILAGVIRKVNGRDTLLYFSLVGTAVGLLTLPVPMLVKSYWITAAWGAEALVLLTVGSLLDRKSIRVGGLAIFILVVMRLFFLDSAVPYTRISHSSIFLNLKFLALVLSAVSFGLGGFALGRLRKVTSEEKGYSGPLWVLFTAGLFWISNVEIFSYFSVHEWQDGMKWILSTVLWAIFSCFFVLCGISRKSFSLRRAGFFMLIATSLKWLLVDNPCLYNTPYGYPFIVNLRFFSLLFLLSVILISAIFYVQERVELKSEEKNVVPALWMSFIVLLFVGLNIETVSYLAKSPILTVRAESFIFTTMLWAIFSLLMLIVGVKRNLSFFRAAGLILITVTFVKAIVDSFFACSCDYGCPLLFNLKFLSVAVVLFSIAYGVSLYADKEMPKTEFEKGVIPYMWTIFIILLFVELNVESVSACSGICGVGEQKMTTALSFLWVLYGFGLLVAGIIKKALPLRISALSLFGITLLKILFVDMQSIGQVYKILLLLGIGSILLICAYFYRRYRKRLEDKNELSDGEEHNP